MIKDLELKREYNRVWYARRRAEFFSGKSCAWCGSLEDLELHHLDPKQKEANSIWSWSKPRREAEIAKCIVLCHSCHAGYHDNLRRRPIRHGTTRGYRRGCRCEDCRRAAYLYNLGYKKLHCESSAL